MTYWGRRSQLENLGAMPWFFRRSVSRGPFRLNFSKRGVGMSIGIRGLRLGSGPRGTYVRGGRGGFYYQQYLRSDRVPGRSIVPAASSPTVAGTATEFVAEPSATGDDAISDINRTRSAFRWSTPLLVLAVVGMIFLATRHAAAGWYLLLVALLAYGAALHRRETLERAIVLHYELDGELATSYTSLCAAFREAARSARIWRVLSEYAHGDRKHNAGATTAVDRTVTAVSFGGAGLLTINLAAPAVEAQTTRVFFLPDKMLTVTGARVGALRYAELHVEDRQTRFSEGEAVPSDATRVATTWLYVNKSGAPDRRFKDNRQLPILLYSHLRLVHPSLTMTLEFSRADAARALADVLRSFVASAQTGQVPANASVAIASGTPAATTAPFEAHLGSTVKAVNRLVERMQAALPSLQVAHDAAQSEPIGRGRAASVPDSLAWIRARIADVEALNPAVLSLCTTELRAALFVGPGQTVPEAEQDAWIASCRAVFARLTAWESQVRSATIAPLFHDAQRLLSGLTSEYVDSLEHLPQQLRASSSTDHTVGVLTSLRLKRVAPLNAELERVTMQLLKRS